MTKSRDRPMCGASRRSSRAHSAWNVEIHIARQFVPSSDFDARAHLLGGLVREGDREHAVRRREAFGDEVRDAMRDDARLARSRARKDQQRAMRVPNRILLFGIEGGEEVHGGTGRSVASSDS